MDVLNSQTNKSSSIYSGNTIVKPVNEEALYKRIQQAIDDLTAKITKLESDTKVKIDELMNKSDFIQPIGKTVTDITKSCESSFNNNGYYQFTKDGWLTIYNRRGGGGNWAEVAFNPPWAIVGEPKDYIYHLFDEYPDEDRTRKIRDERWDSNTEKRIMQEQDCYLYETYERIQGKSIYKYTVQRTEERFVVTAYEEGYEKYLISSAGASTVGVDNDVNTLPVRKGDILFRVSSRTPNFYFRTL